MELSKDLVDFILNKNIESIEIENEDYFVLQRIQEKVPSIDKNSARLLYFLSFLKKPEYILEIGFGSGFSCWAIWLGAREKIKKIISFEHEKKRFLKGIDFINKNSMPVNLINKDFSKENLLIESEKANIDGFDLIFIDGTKREYPLYYNDSFDFLKKDGLILFDNVLFNGNLLKLVNMEEGKNVQGGKILYHFLSFVSQDKRIVPFFLPIGDGLLACIKK
ncbi:MAG: hypothetical protein GYA61_02400 [Spirochaetales bacterium]|jgi:predicted O-methyltransferase YrrM|nr:hypothetical protein [Exilispira sp.]NMC67053.1 hypothetical protein [Spirochaetales bacterium]